MKPLVSIESSSHWYTRNGKPCHQVPYAGKRGEAGEMRNTTLKDARKMGLLPSVTSIIGIVEKPGLIRWKMGQIILAALTLPRLEDEGVDQFAQRVIEDAMAESRKAMDFGSRLHDAIEAIVARRPSVRDSEIEPFASRFAAWHHEHGGALTNCALDWKTQSTKANKPFVFYPEWVWQLAAYNHGIFRGASVPQQTDGAIWTEARFGFADGGYGGTVDYVDSSLPFRRHTLISVAISSREPGRIEMKVWTAEEAAWGLKVFTSLLNTWIAIKKYDPRKEVE